MDEVKFPEVEVTLVGKNSNAYNIMGIVTNAMKKAKISKEDREAFMNEAMSGDYDHLLQTCMKTVTVN